MADERFEPTWVLDFCLVNSQPCCGNAELLPFKCRKPSCGQVLVMCYECDALLIDLLREEAAVDFDGEHCPKCGEAFSQDYPSAVEHRVTFDEWNSEGLNSLIVLPSQDEFVARLAFSTEELTACFRKADWTSIRIRNYVWHPIQRFRHLAEGIEGISPLTQIWRESGKETAREIGINRALENENFSTDELQRGFYLLGITDWLAQQKSVLGRTE